MLRVSHKYTSGNHIYFPKNCLQNEIDDICLNGTESDYKFQKHFIKHVSGSSHIPRFQSSFPMVRSKLIKQIEMSFEDNQILFQSTLFYAEASDYKNPADKQTKKLGATFGLKLRRFISQKQEVLREKDVLRNFVKFTEKHLCQSLFYNKSAGLRLQLY